VSVFDNEDGRKEENERVLVSPAPSGMVSYNAIVAGRVLVKLWMVFPFRSPTRKMVGSHQTMALTVPKSYVNESKVDSNYKLSKKTV